MPYIIIFHAGLWAILFLCLKLCRNIDTDIPLSLWIIFLFIPVCSLASSIVLIPLLNGNILSRPASDIFHLVIQMTLLFIGIALLSFLQRFTEYFMNEREQELLRQQLQYQENLYRQLISSSDQIQKIRHDMKNHLQAISLLYEENKTEELQQYLRTASDLLGQSERIISTGNPSLDAVLNVKLAEMNRKNISCSPELSVPRGLKFPFSDTVTILGNLLDNAINSCLQFSSTNTDTASPAVRTSDPVSLTVSLSIFWQQGTLLIHMTNPCRDTSKAPYGIGMKNVEETVKKYSGTLSTEVREGKYITDIILYKM